MGKNKKPKHKSIKSKKLLAVAGVITAVTALLKVIFDFVIQLLSLGH